MKHAPNPVAVPAEPLTVNVLQPYVFPVAHSTVPVPTGKGSQSLSVTMTYWEGRVAEVGRALVISEALLPIVWKLHCRATWTAHYVNSLTLIESGDLVEDSSVQSESTMRAYRPTPKGGA